MSFFREWVGPSAWTPPLYVPEWLNIRITHDFLITYCYYRLRENNIRLHWCFSGFHENRTVIAPGFNSDDILILYSFIEVIYVYYILIENLETLYT